LEGRRLCIDSPTVWLTLWIDGECVVCTLLHQTSRENKYVEIRRTLEDFIRTRTKTDEKFQGFVYEELATLKNEIAKETQVCAGCVCVVV
jgi:hypothetical protein